MRKYSAEIALIITSIIWGSGFVATAMALSYYSPYQTLAIRFLIGFLLLSLFFYPRLQLITKRVLIKGSILGSLLYIAFALQTVGLAYTTASKNAFLTSVNVVIVPFIGYFLYKRTINRYEWIGAILAIIGIAVLSLELSTEVNFGDVLTLLCAVGFAFHIFYTARFVQDEDPIILTIIQMATASLIGFLVIGLRGEFVMSLEWAGVLPLVYIGVFSTTIAYFLQTSAQKYVTETKTAIILSTEALWGTLFAVLILHELLTTRMILGSIIILGAIVVSETKLQFRIKKKPIS